MRSTPAPGPKRPRRASSTSKRWRRGGTPDRRPREDTTMDMGYLIDTTNCIGCRACQSACKQWKHLPGEQTQLNGLAGNLTNPRTLSAKTLTVIQFHELEDDKAPGGLRYLFAKRQCMHCI